MFCKFHRENPKNLQRHRVRAIEKRRGSSNAYLKVFILSAEKQPIKSVWRKIECLPQTPEGLQR